MQREDAPLAGMRAQGILKPLMLRRTKDSKLVRTIWHTIPLRWMLTSHYIMYQEGKPILELPPKNIEIVTLNFSAEERDVSVVFPRDTLF
jgi:SNF2 family DNA or RNA helicase